MNKLSKAGLGGFMWTAITTGGAMLSQIYACKTSGDIQGKVNAYHFRDFFTHGDYLFIILAIAIGILLDFLMEYKEPDNRPKYGRYPPILMIVGSCGIFFASFLGTTSLQADPGGITPAALSESVWTFWGSVGTATILKSIVFYANSKSQ